MLRERLRRDIGARLVDGFFERTSQAGRMFPLANPRLHNVEVFRDIPYAEGGRREHLLDIYRPRGGAQKLPTVLYIHGGGFRILSKDTHWLFGLLFARRGYVVANINYRLAPHRFPAAHQDAFTAFQWVVDNIERYGGDPSQLILAGESAGGNLCTSLAVATSYRRSEPWAAEVFARGVSPRAVVSACGLLQVSEPERFGRPKKLAPFIQDRMDEVAAAYLGETAAGDHCAMADPLLLLEQAAEPERPLPPFFAFSGTWDPVISDTRRLVAALERLSVPHEARYYRRGIHAFHAFVFDPNARRCWRDTFNFLERQLPEAPRAATTLFA
jgi:acetyl esterase